jgi:hypothetical protein
MHHLTFCGKDSIKIVSLVSLFVVSFYGTWCHEES